MDKDYRWKIWLYISTDLPDLLPVFQSLFQADNLTYDCENVWEWLTGSSARFNTTIDLSREHHNEESLYSEPVVILTGINQLDDGKLEQIQTIALALTEICSGPVFYGFATLRNNHSYILEPVGQLARQNIAIGIANPDGSSFKPEAQVFGDQDRQSAAWDRLSSYITETAKNNSDEFIPLSALGTEAFSAIKTLPASIGTLKQVTKMQFYGSQLQYLPPEIGDCSALTYFDPYTSYDLHWFPYEITRCTVLKSSRVSTRALYGNYKTRLPFPDLRTTPYSI